MTARGFGKRNDENMQSGYGRENEIESNNSMIHDKCLYNIQYLPCRTRHDK